MGNDSEGNGWRHAELSDVTTSLSAASDSGGTSYGPRSETTPADPPPVVVRIEQDFDAVFFGWCIGQSRPSPWAQVQARIAESLDARAERVTAAKVNRQSWPTSHPQATHLRDFRT